MEPVIIHPITNEFIRNYQDYMLVARSDYVAPDELETKPLEKITNFSKTDVCRICLDTFSIDSDVRTLPCSHNFHNDCIMTAMKHSSTCPNCRTTIHKVQGRMPSGTMRVRIIKSRCTGYDCATYEITYSFPDGVQKVYHPNPGKPYKGTIRTTYVPCSPANDILSGVLLVRRLIFAFENGLTFMVGTSLTTGVDNCIIWASIHHKTTLYSSQHGYPDPLYFKNVNEELDNLNVPQI